MPIEALPQNTVRAIGSTSVIADPCSIVKELLDNALDASASSVFVEISQNTVDVIQVKDNGHGISSGDHAVVCKRTFTSKIQTVEDLRNIGGKSLGFRGEALASAAEMSGGLTVTTRVGTEMVGSTIKYARNGELISSQRAPHPVGTTVRITDFLKSIPVRRQTALKSTGKTLSKIKKLLQAYTMCQPSKRLSLKVIKAKNETSNWMYAGGQSASLMDAAMKVVGTDVVSQCTVKKWPPEEDSAEYRIVAILAKGEADFTKVNNAGQYFGVDGRPLATGRGIARDITKIYRNYLRSATSDGSDSTSVNDPFLCLQIQCPLGCYDANIEPAKDDILFEDPQRVLSLVEDLLRDMYGDLVGSVEKKGPSNKGKERMSYNDGFELLMAQKSPVPPTPQPGPTSYTSKPSYSTPFSSFKKPPPRASRDVSTPMEDDASHASQDNGHKEGQDLESLNPWSITKIIAPFRTPVRAQAGSSTVPLITNTARRESLQRSQGATQMSSTSSRSSALPSPSTSNSNSNSTSTSQTDSRTSPSAVQNPQTSPITPVQNNVRRARECDRERYGNGALDTWFQRITQAGIRRNEHLSKDEYEPELEEQEPSLTQLAPSRFGSTDQSPSNSSATTRGLFTQDDPDDTQVTREFSEQLAQDQVSSGPSQPEAKQKRQELPVLEKWSSRLHQLPNSRHNAELEQALEFENRKKEAILQRREEMKNRLETPISTNSPHHSRYLAARASLNSRSHELQAQASLTPAGPTTEPALSPSDSRAYLIRQNSHQQELPKDGKARRILTSKLPLEKIPEGDYLHDVCLTVPFDVSALSSSVEEGIKHDLYTQSGIEFEAFTESCSESCFDLWGGRLSHLITENYKAESGAPCLDFDFSHIPHLPGSEYF